MNKKFYGTGVAIITPFDIEKKIDYKALERIIEFQISNGINYIVSLGTTGESVTLDKSEKKTLIDFTSKQIAGRVPLVIGIGGNNTHEVLKQFDDYDFSCIDAVLSVCPYYNKPQQAGIIEHYKAVAAKSPKPIILYNVPGRTGVNLKAETTIYLAKNVPNIIAVKEASGSIEQIMKIVLEKPKDFMVISGDDALTMPMISIGVVGVISVVANAYPKEFSSMVNLCLEGKYQDALPLHYKLLNMIDALFSEGSPGGIKALLNIKKLCQQSVRLPLVPISQKHYDYINELAEKISK